MRMIPKMPSLIAANNEDIDADDLYKQIDSQIQFVKQIKALLDTEQAKLEALMSKMTKNTTKKTADSFNEETGNVKRIRVCSPSSINRNIDEDKKEDEQEDVEDTDADSSNCKKEIEFKRFWSSSTDWSLLEDSQKESAQNPIDIEQLVDEEVKRIEKSDEEVN